MSHFGPYRLLKCIARGGMGEIYLAQLERESGFAKAMVIKRILPQYSDDPAFVEMFTREARIAAQLSHQNVVQIFDHGQHGGNYFIAMEYVHGRDLRTLLEAARTKDHPQLPLPVAMAIITATARGLSYAHRCRDLEGRSLNIIHRDVSPQNILLSYEGEIKLTDFGLAHAVDDDAVEEGQVQGKFAYMSPEQTFGHELDARSDLFSLGIVAFELLAGQRPFDGDSTRALVNAIRSGDHPHIVDLRPELPPSLGAVLDRTLARKPDDRYPDLRAFLDALESVMREQPLIATEAAVGALVAVLCPPESPASSALAGGTLVSQQPIGPSALERTMPAVKPVGAGGTVPAASPIATDPRPTRPDADSPDHPTTPEEPSSDGVPHDPGPAPLPIALPEPVHASEAASAQPPAASERPTHSTPSVGEEAEPVAPPRATEPSESTPAQSDESGTERATKGAGATVQSDGLAVGDAQAIAKRSGAAVKGAGAMAPNNEGGIEGTEDNGDSDDIAVKDAEATPKNDEGGTAGTEDNDGKTSTGRTVGGSPPLFPGRWIVAASVVLLGCGTAAAVVLTTRPPPEPPAWTLEIKAHPEHAEVEVDGQPRGVTPTRVERLPGGRTVQLLIKHDGYEPHVRNLALDAEHGGTIPVNVKLEPRKRLGQVRLDVLPKDAQVVLEGNPIPASPNNPGLYRIAREPGEVQVEVTAAHHFPRSETVEVPSNGGVLRHTLQLIPHPVRVEVVSAGRATRGKVTVEAGDRFTSHCGLPCSLKVPYPGPISVEARVDGREPWRATRTGRAGAVVRFEVPAPAPPRREAEARLRGTLSRLREDGEREAAGFGEVNLSRAPSGFRRAALKGGPNVTLRYAYDANTRRVKFTLGSDPWSQVTFDGSPAGQTPLVNRWISSGRHTIWLVNHNAVVHLNFHHP